MNTSNEIIKKAQTNSLRTHRTSTKRNAPEQIPGCISVETALRSTALDILSGSSRFPKWAHPLWEGHLSNGQKKNCARTGQLYGFFWCTLRGKDPTWTKTGTRRSDQALNQNLINPPEHVSCGPVSGRCNQNFITEDPRARQPEVVGRSRDTGRFCGVTTHDRTRDTSCYVPNFLVLFFRWDEKE